MQKKDCFLVGTVFKLHGYKGDVKIYNNDDIPFNFTKLEHFLIQQNNILVPYFIEKARATKPNIILVKFEDVNSEEEAEKINKCKVYLPKHLMPEKYKKETNERALINYSVINIKKGELLGKISHINSQTTQKLIYVEKNGKEFCFPMHKEFIKEIDSKEKKIKVVMPEDLINLN